MTSERIATRIARGLRYEAKRSRRGVLATHARVAKLIGLRSAVELLALLNPQRRRAPRRVVRQALERLSKRWPVPIGVNDWRAY